MPKQINRLGKGLDALIPNIIPNAPVAIETIDINAIQPNPFQPRQHFDESALNELAHSIKAHGLTQPIVVRRVANYYELVVGERRLKACQKNKQTTILAIVKNISDQQSCELALVENIDRENLSIIEVAQSLQQLIDSFGYTQDTLAQLFSRSRSSIANILRLLKLPADVQTMVLLKQLSEGHARTLIQLSDTPDQCLAMAHNIIENNISVRDAEKHAAKTKKKTSKKPKLNLFDNYTEKLSTQLNTNVKINHRKNQLTIQVEYDRFKDYIAFLDQLCTIEMPPSES
ncbi:MAG: ParB/RepB/Spo0J family partition protein [Candidatus Marinamargulisbacteria bacterium]